MLSIILITGCTKEGPEGPQGPPGEDGKDGNANVVSITKTIGTNDWSPEGTAEVDLLYYVEISIPEITNSIVQDGLVVVFASEPSSGTFIALPMTILGSYFHTTYSYAFQLGKVVIEVQDSDMNTYRPENNIEFKIVVIDGSVNITGLNLKEYSIIKELMVN